MSIFLDLRLHLHPLNQAYLLVLGYQNREFALLIDDVEGVQSLALASDKEAHKGILQEFIAAAAQNDILILDGKKLLQDARLLIRTY